MKLNWAERWVVNNPLRVLGQRLEIGRFKKMMPLNPGSVALEIGCGRGAGAGLIMEEYEPSWIYAMDLDIRMLKMGKDYLVSRKKKRISLSAGDACYLPVKTASMDAVFDFGALHHVPDWRSSLAEIARVLKSGGLFFIEEYYPALYQNFITRRILVHPEEDRFTGPDFRQAMFAVKLNLKEAMESKWLGILGVAVKD
ncbi:MAG: class I SAM-dependent methyltransferase [Thermodesulfobacteriota bacterium]